MEQEESLFILVTKGQRKTIYLRQRKDGIYYFSKEKKSEPKQWLLKNMYIEEDTVTLQFIGDGTGEKRNLAVISDERYEKLFYYIEPSKFAPFPHKARTYDTAKQIERFDQEDRINEQKNNIWILLGIILFLIILFIRLATL